jgi:hypothetical protein
MTHQERRQKIDALKALRDSIYKIAAPVEAELSKLILDCKHEVGIPPDFYEKLAKDEWHSATGHCIGCGYGTGWFCPSSPDHMCDYTDPDEPERYREECQFCGMPEERK